MYLTATSLLTKPTKGEMLYLHPAMPPVAVSSILAQEDEGIQKSMYYNSRLLKDAETATREGRGLLMLSWSLPDSFDPISESPMGTRTLRTSKQTSTSMKKFKKRSRIEQQPTDDEQLATLTLESRKKSFAQVT